ncbi:MAG: hypothetical protein LBL91_02360 [Lachnospiraceae bacterium]|jgi:hypothetical protein|nr:hypothetical protein [Lachnospiraceae bacterium]
MGKISDSIKRVFQVLGEIDEPGDAEYAIDNTAGISEADLKVLTNAQNSVVANEIRYDEESIKKNTKKAIVEHVDVEGKDKYGSSSNGGTRRKKDTGIKKTTEEMERDI